MCRLVTPSIVLSPSAASRQRTRVTITVLSLHRQTTPNFGPRRVYLRYTLRRSLGLSSLFNLFTSNSTSIRCTTTPHLPISPHLPRSPHLIKSNKTYILLPILKRNQNVSQELRTRPSSLPRHEQHLHQIRIAITQCSYRHHLHQLRLRLRTPHRRPICQFQRRAHRT